LTKQLQQAEDTIKLAAGALKNEKKRHMEVGYQRMEFYELVKICVSTPLSQ